MITIKYNKAVVKAMIAKIESSPQAIDKAIQTALFRIGTEVQGEAGTLAPYKTGNLRRSITSKVERKLVRIGSKLVYSRIQDKGGRAGRNHSVTIKGNRYLSSTYEKYTDGGKAEKIFKEEIDKVYLNNYYD